MSAETTLVAPVQPALKPIAPPCPAYLPPGGIVMPVEEYLEWERNSEVRYEYVDFYAIPKGGVQFLANGEIRAIMGDYPAENEITGNIMVKLDRDIGDSSCDVYFKSIRLRVSSTQVRYPDVSALCGVAQFDNADPPCLLNPSLLVEVMSPYTQRADQNEKFHAYKVMPTVSDYVVVAQDRMFVTHYTRQSVSHWTVTDYEQPTDVLTFPTLDVSISLEDIYRDIVFAPSA